MKRFLRLMLTGILIINISCPSTLHATEVDTPSAKDAGDQASGDEDFSHLWPDAPGVDADSAILMDLSSGLILYEKNSHREQYPASITKIMTTLLALENCSLGEIVTFSHDAVFGIEQGSSHIGIDVGEKLTMEQCLYAIMLASANEVSSGVAEHVGSTISDFADMMNQRAKELGCLNTHFVNANGLHSDEHYTSAYDMALISRQAMKIPAFRKITSTKRFTIPPTNKHNVDNVFPNHHQMLNGYNHPKYEYEYCIGGKTGYTTKAGNTLVTFAEKDGIQLVCVVMRANGPASPRNEYTDTTSLFDFAFEHYTQYNLTGGSIKSFEDSPLFTQYTPFFNPEDTPLQVEENSYVLLPNTADFADVEESMELYDNSELKDGQNVIGKITFTYGGKTVGSTNVLFNKKDTSKLTLAQPAKKVENTEVSAPARINLKPFIIAGICIIVIICIWFYFYFNNPHRKNRKKYNLRF